MEENKNQPITPTEPQTPPPTTPETPQTTTPNVETVTPPVAVSAPPVVEPASPTPTVITTPTATRSKWSYVFIILGIAQIVLPAAFITVLLYAGSTLEGLFIGILLTAVGLPALAILGLVNLVGLAIYIGKLKPKGIELALEIISMAISIPLVGVGGFVMFILQTAFH